MPDWFTQNGIATQAAPAEPAKADWFAQNGVQTVNATAPAQPEPGGIGHLAEEFWKRANPMSWIDGLVETAKHPVDAAVNLVTADPKFLDQAKDAAGKGDYLTAGRKVLSYLSMGLGHELDTQADMGAKGDLSGMTGAMLGTATQFVAPDAAMNAVGAVAPRVAGAMRVSNVNPAAAEAVEAGRAAGVPIDAATATGNKAVRAVQHIADRTIGGAAIGARAEAAQARGLASMGEQLAAKGHPVATTAEQAGEGLRVGTRAKLGEHADAANAAYDDLRQIAEQHVVDVPVEPAAGTPGAAQGRDSFRPGRFAEGGAKPEDIFQGVLADARRNGFKGSADALKTEFTDRLRSGRSLAEDMAQNDAELGPKALLADIRKLGGIRPFTKDLGSGTKLRGDFASIVETFGSKSGWGQRGASSVFRKEGLGLDDLVDQLKQDPKWQHVIGDENDLMDALDDIGRQGPAAVGEATGDLEHLLSATGVRPGEKWWTQASEPTQAMAMPVDLTKARPGLQPIYDALKRQSELTPAAMMGDKARALQALDKLMNGPNTAALADVDAALGDLKSFARADVPELRTGGQGAAAGAVKYLDALVRQTAEAAGPEALDALLRGRDATKAKYGIADIYDTIKAEPVQAFKKATAAGDANIAHLRDLEKAAPDQMPVVGRAWLDGLLEKAGQNGGFEHRAAISSAWEKMGPETKNLLFKDPAYQTELDKFFRLVRQTSENANPSGTAHVVATLSHVHSLMSGLTGLGEQAGWAAVSSFMHSPAGVRLLTEGIRLPGSAAARAMWQSRVVKFAQTNGLLQAARPQSAIAGQ
jgi:hypothetical protein